MVGAERKNEYNWIETNQLIKALAYGFGVMHEVMLSFFMRKKKDFSVGYYFYWLTGIVNVTKLSADCEPVLGRKCCKVSQFFFFPNHYIS